MANTVKHQPNSSEYIKVVFGTTNDFFLQNVSNKTAVYVIWGTTVPAADSKGHLLEVGDAVVRSGLTGKVYARALNGDAVVSVTEE